MKQLPAAERMRLSDQIFGEDWPLARIQVLFDDVEPGWTVAEIEAWLKNEALVACANCGTWRDESEIVDEYCPDCQEQMSA